MNISLGIQLLLNLKMNSNLQNGLTKKKRKSQAKKVTQGRSHLQK